MTGNVPSQPWRTQPPSISDPKRNTLNLSESGVETETPHDGQMFHEEEEAPEGIDWQQRALDAYTFSTTYFDSNYRKQFENGIRAFNNLHPGESKYMSAAYVKRSAIYRPKTREVIRKNEAAAASAFFSNMDRVSIEAVNMSDQKQRMSAEVMKELLQFRLEKSIPWFQIVQGGIQDAQTVGVCAAHAYWKFVQTPAGKIIDDKPCFDLIPVENIRFDGAASWIDVVNTSPYFIHLIPMYICDVKDRMDRPDPKGRTWKTYDDDVLKKSMFNDDDSTRSQRLMNQQDPTQIKRDISDYDVVWVHRHIHRYMGRDFEFYTLASQYMLTEAEPLTNTVFHGLRPYIMGCAILETHKTVPSSVPTLVSGLQEEINEVTNQRLDNVKLVMNKKWFIKRGKNVDIPQLMRNVPGAGVLLDDPETDVKAVDFADVTSSAYVESEKLDASFDALVGNFSAAQVQQQRSPRESEGTMRLLQSPASVLTEYMLKTYTDTFITPLLRHLILLEQHYETDNKVLAIAGQRAQSFQKFGVDKVTDEMLEQELSVNVNVGMGATDPTVRLQRLAAGIMLIEQMTKLPPPGVNLSELFREIFALCGYQYGDRFLTMDPQIAQMQKQVQGLAMKLGLQVKNKEGEQRTKLQIGREKNQAHLLGKAMDHHSSAKLALAEHIMDLEKMGTEAALAPPEQPKPNGGAK